MPPYATSIHHVPLAALPGIPVGIHQHQSQQFVETTRIEPMDESHHVLVSHPVEREESSEPPAPAPPSDTPKSTTTTATTSSTTTSDKKNGKRRQSRSPSPRGSQKARTGRRANDHNHEKEKKKIGHAHKERYSSPPLPELPPGIQPTRSIYISFTNWNLVEHISSQAGCPPDATPHQRVQFMENILHKEFERFGKILSIRVLPGRDYGFINFQKLSDAIRAYFGLIKRPILDNPKIAIGFGHYGAGFPESHKKREIR